MSRKKTPKMYWSLWELVSFFESFSHLMLAGLPLLQALSILKVHGVRPSEQQLIAQLEQKLTQGFSFAKSWQEVTRESLSSALFSVAEESGAFALMLKHITQYAKSQLAWRRLWWQALRYPLFLCGLTLLLILLLCVWVIPQFASLYESFHVKLPQLTQWIVQAGQSMQHHGLQLMAVIGVSIAIMFFFRRHSYVQPYLYRCQRAFSLYRRAEELRFWHAVALLLNAGLSLKKSIQVCQGLFQTLSMQQAMRLLLQQLKHGVRLSVILRQNRLFSPSLIAMMAMAEESGQLSSLLLAYVEQGITEMQLRMDALKTWAEPLVLCLVGILVGVVLIALYLPMVELGKWV